MQFYDHIPTRRALSKVAAVRTGSCLNSDWRQRPGRPRATRGYSRSGTFRNPRWMVQGLPSWAFQVDATDLRCLHDPMMMMIMMNFSRNFTITRFFGLVENNYNSTFIWLLFDGRSTVFRLSFDVELQSNGRRMGVKPNLNCTCNHRLTTADSLQYIASK